MRYKAIISYDGTAYQGFQSQPNALGIQTLIEKAFRLMTQQDIKIYASGRTDKGVHAKGQVFHFDTEILIDEKTWIRGLHKRLPLDIRIESIKEVKDTFHARHSAQSKIYHYKIAKKPSSVFTKNYEVYVENLDIEKIKEAIPLLEGTHDFKGFCQYVKGKPTIKTIYSVKLKETKDHYTLIFHGNSFLKYMVRSMVGTLIQIGLHRKNPEIITEILTTQNRFLAGKTAEARGLYLVKIHY